MSEQVFTLMTRDHTAYSGDEGYLEGIFATAEGAVQYASQLVARSGGTVRTLSDETDAEGARVIELQEVHSTGWRGCCMTVAMRYVQRMRGDA